MPSQGYTPAENVVILYFASMGFSDNALILLLKHKCQGSGTRLVTYMHSKRSYMKTKPGVWNAMTTRWDLYEVGRYLSGIMSDPVEFRKMIAVGPEEESIYLAELHLPDNYAALFDGLRFRDGIIVNEVTRGYYETLGIAQLPEATKVNTTVKPSGATQSAGATQGSVNLDYYDFGQGY